jgi:hypothetical protein
MKWIALTQITEFIKICLGHLHGSLPIVRLPASIQETGIETKSALILAGVIEDFLM